MTKRSDLLVRRTTRDDIQAIRDLSEAIYPFAPPWSERQLTSHLDVFPEGQFVAIHRPSGRLIGMAASLIVLWDDYDVRQTWREFTDGGMFTNHDPEHGRTLYGAEVMVHPGRQGQGVGKALYAARRELVQGLGLLRIRAGARLRGYHRYKDRLSAEEYVVQVIRGELGDPTLSFQLGQGFHVIAVVLGYLSQDPESLGHAAVIEWLNPLVATPADAAGRPPQFRAPGARTPPAPRAEEPPDPVA